MAEKQMVVIPKKETPTWYLHPPISTDMQLYALGEGANKKEAIANALSLMASTLSVSISSEFNAKTIIKEGTHFSKDASYINSVQSDVQKIRISNYEVLESEKLGFKNYIVLLSSNKQQLFQSLKKELDMNFVLYEEKSKELTQTNSLKLLTHIKEEYQKLGQIQNRLLVMSVLEPDFNNAAYIKKIKNVQSDYEKLLSKISFSISSNSEAKNLVAVIAKGLNAEKFLIKRAASKYHFSVHVESDIHKTFAYGFILARSAIVITTKDYRGNIIASNKLNITGQSSQSFEIAKENIAFRLNKLLKQEGIEQILGM